MRIENKDIQPGDNLIFKRGKGPGIALVLSLLIKLFYPGWDMWGWHMGIVVRREGTDWMVLEAAWPRVRLTALSGMGEYRGYRWFAVMPENSLIEAFVKANLRKHYDVLLYPWTAVQYLFRHFWNKPFPRLLDDRFTCWEMCCEFDETMGKPIISKYDCPLLPDIQQELEKQKIPKIDSRS